MRDIHPDFAAGIKSCIRVAAGAALALISACATPPVVVKTDPSFALSQIRSVYVVPFASPDDHRDAGPIMTQALREQLQADGILRVVDQPGLADAYLQGNIEKWVQGGLDLSGTRPTRVGGSLALLDPSKRPLWSAVAEQWDPLRMLADGLFARDPSALAPHWVRTVLQQLPGYTPRRRPGMADLWERLPAGKSIAELARVYMIPPREYEVTLQVTLTVEAAQKLGMESQMSFEKRMRRPKKVSLSHRHLADEPCSEAPAGRLCKAEPKAC